MSEEQKNSHFTAADIERYLEGKMPAEERYAVEKAALSDPFLAEAMEGFETVPVESWKPALDALKKDFSTKKEGAKIIALKPSSGKWWKMAAAIFLLAGAAALTYTLTRDNQPSSDKQWVVAENKNQDQVENSIKLDSPIAATENTIPSTPKVLAVKAKSAVASNKDAFTFTTAKADSNFIYTPAPAVTENNKDQVLMAGVDDQLKTPITTSSPVMETKSLSANAPINNNNIIPAPGVFYDKRAEAEGRQKQLELDYKQAQAKKEQALNQHFFAQVVGPDNSPLPFANISIKTEDFGTYADVKGNFRLISMDSLLTVEVKSVGYQPQLVTLRSNQSSNKIMLNEKATVAVEDLAKFKKSAPQNSIRRSRLLRDSIQNVEPADGWENYDTYVNNNIELPEEVTKKNIHGQVELSFDVSSSGAISNIKIDKSLCGDCDEAAKKLIEQGPRWKIKDGKKSKAKLKLQF
ncbi:MAG: carboxypeptidase-like regulatory domain-containing protein [Chitinophagaceae bacterium]